MATSSYLLNHVHATTIWLLRFYVVCFGMVRYFMKNNTLASFS